MIVCHWCKEPIEFGEAATEEYLVGTHRTYFHIGCHHAWSAQRFERKQEAVADYEEIARLARTVT